ncbi:MAG: virulence RhuM family protein [Paludibacteraceae bacterium]|nr:virulence RhuM family protein [Paludibacteraceae bacterium]
MNQGEQLNKYTPQGEMVIYRTDDGKATVDVMLENETVWLTQKQMANLFETTPQNITMHVRNVYRDGELVQTATCKDFLQVQKEGSREIQRVSKFYNLEVVLAVGYRVRSKRGIEFRRWASERLKEYIVKGYTMDVERLKGNAGGQYWYDLLATIKDIRSSEKVLYRQVLDLYATSVDYDPKAEDTILFFKMVQNKLHYATHGQTAPELIYHRADAEQPFMGLTTFKGSHPTQADVTIAKNYLSETELRKLNNMVSGYFDFAENRAMEHVPTTMKEYRELLDRILSANGSPVLDNAGSISADQAREKAISEYRKYQVRALTPVEQAYYASLKAIEETTKKKK